jgi:hypothetical protein
VIFCGFEAGVKWANTGAEVLPGVFVGIALIH